MASKEFMKFSNDYVKGGYDNVISSMIEQKQKKQNILDETYSRVMDPMSSKFDMQKSAQDLAINTNPSPRPQDYTPEQTQDLGVPGFMAMKILEPMTNIAGAIRTYQNKDNPLFLQQEQTARQELEAYSKKHPVANFIGTALGFLGPGLLASKGAGVLAKPLLNKITNNIGRVAVQEGIAGAGLGATDAFTKSYAQGLEGTDLLKETAKGAGYGGLFGGVLGAGLAGLGKVLPGAFSKAKDFTLGRNADEAFANLSNRPTSGSFKPPQTAEDINFLNSLSPEDTKFVNELNRKSYASKNPNKYIPPQSTINQPKDVFPINQPKDVFPINQPKDVFPINQPEDVFPINNVKKFNPLVPIKRPTITQPVQEKIIQPEPIISEPITPKTKYSPEIQAQLDAIDTKLIQNKDSNKLNFRDTQVRSKADMGSSMEASAKKRAIIQGDSLIPVEGGFTPKEIANEVKRLKSNYAGKEIITPDGEGIATGQNSFGKVGVKLSDGTIKYYPSEKITPKIDIEAKINAQKQALNASKIESNINLPSNKIEPIKTPTNESNINKNKIMVIPPNETYIQNQKIIDAFDNIVSKIESKNILPSKIELTPQNPKVIMNASGSKINIPEQPIIQPDITTGNMKNRKFIENSYLNSDVPTPQMKAEMQTKIPQYPEISNQNTLDEAYKIIDSDFKGNAKDFLETSELHGALDTAKGIGLIQRAVAKGDHALANDISINLAEKLTKSGQEIQASSIMKRMTPEGMLNYANKQINNYNKSQVGKKGFEPLKLTSEESKTIIDNMELIRKANNGELILPKINLQLFADSKLAEIFKIIGNKIPANLGAKGRAWQRISLLLNLKTLIRNPTGNVIMAGVKNTSDTLRAGLDKTASLFTKERTALLPDIKTQLGGAKQGLERLKSDVKLGINTSPTGTQYELGQGSLAVSPFKNKYLKKLDEITTTALRLGDDPFYQATYNDALRVEMKLANTNTATAEMMKKAEKIGREVTFQDTNYMTKLFSGVQKGLNNIGTKNFGLGNIVLPFIKTPANILARALEYSPAEIIPMTLRLVKDATQGTKFNQYKFVDSLAKSITGTALIGAGYELAKRGIISGKAPPDIDARNFEKTSGILPYSFEVDGKSYTYDWAQPSAIPIAVGADMYYQLKHSKKPEQALLEAGASGLNTLFSQSLVQGLSKMFGSSFQNQGGGFAENLTNIALGAPSQFIPLGSTMRQIGEVTDPYQRNLTGETNIETNLINPIKNQIPFLRKTLPAKVDSFGQKVPSKSIINTFINPANTSTINKSEAISELSRLYNQSNESKQFPQLGKSSISYKTGKNEPSVNQKLTPQGLELYQQALGKANMQAIQNTIQTPKYQNSNDKEKAEMISNILSKTKQSEESNMLSASGIDEYKALQSRTRQNKRSR